MRLQTMAPTPFGLAMLALCAAASAESVLNKRDEEPALTVKPGTISTCNFWYDNGFGESCEVVRDWFFEISPEDFHRWNPSVSLDCQGWEDWYSYCVRIEDSSPSTTSSKPSTTTAATTTSTSAPPKPTVKTWEPLGCYLEEGTLSAKSTREGGSALTVDKCQAACWLDDFTFAGLKSGTECWCGAFVAGYLTKNQADCKLSCPGNSSQKCGGDKLLNVYRAVLDDPSPGSPVTATTTTPASITTTAGAAGATWVPQGCYKDLAPDVVRLLPNRLINGNSLTIERCHTACRDGGYTMAGVENGNQCFCGHDIQEPAKNTPTLESECSTGKPCAANSAQTCGAAARIFIYRYAVPKEPVWQPLGCHKDLAPDISRPLTERVINGGSVTIERCQNLCRSSGGKTLAGVENGNQCFCGHEIEEPTKNVWVSPSECGQACTGNSSQTCGSRARMYIYQYAAPERRVWRSLGCYKDLYPSASRVLDTLIRSGSMTIESCHASCQDSVYRYSGLENGNQCWCGNDIRDPSTNVLTVMSECGTACTGNKDQTCGRSARMHIYEYVTA